MAIHLDLANGIARIPEHFGMSEGKKPRAAQLGAELIARLRARKERNPGTTYIFETQHGTPCTSIDKWVIACAKRAGVSLVGKAPLHSMRKFFATRLINSGRYDVYRVSKLLGHSDVRTTEIYLQLDHENEHQGTDLERILGLAATA